MPDPSPAHLPRVSALDAAPRTPADWHARVLRIDALAAMDGTGVRESPASLLIEFVPPSQGDSNGAWRAHLLAVGRPVELDAHPACSPGAASMKRIVLPRAIVIPGLVNAHTHLDLTHIGPRQFDPAGGFQGWVEMIRTGRLSDERAIRESVRDGLRRSWAGGVVAVGDIAGAVGGRASLAAVMPVLESRMGGVSFVEFFAIGAHESRAIAHMQSVMQTDGAAVSARVGLQPHAPYSVSHEAYVQSAALAKAQGRRMCTHLAESADERELITRGTGRLRTLLEQVGAWTPELQRAFGRAASPVQHLGVAALRDVGMVVHVNQASDEDIALLAQAGATVVYCPRASAYFGHEREFGPHRYQDMIRAGIPVALGTDSIVNLDTPDRISPLDDARLLWARDGERPERAIAMCTHLGAQALGLKPRAFTLTQSAAIAGLVAIEVVESGQAAPTGLQRNAIGGVVLGANASHSELLFGGTDFA